jgi:excisionase family DNA binding protein
MSWVSVAEFAEMAGVSEKVVRSMISRGDLPAHRLGRIFRIDPEEARAATAYAPGGTDAPARRPSKPRAVNGEFSRLARESPHCIRIQ